MEIEKPNEWKPIFTKEKVEKMLYGKTLNDWCGEKYQNPDEREYYAQQLPAKTWSILTTVKNLKKAIKQIEKLSEVDEKI